MSNVTRSGKVAPKYHTGRIMLVPKLCDALEVRTPPSRGPGRVWKAGPPLAAAPMPAADPDAVVRIGYCRTSMVSQELQSQLDALDAVGCLKVYAEQISTRIPVRPKLEAAISHARTIKEAVPGQTMLLTVHELKRLGRGFAELITTANGLMAERKLTPLLTLTVGLIIVGGVGDRHRRHPSRTPVRSASTSGGYRLMARINIQECTAPDELFRRYDGQSQAQPAYLELGLESGGLSADYNAEIGGAIPFEVYHGFVRRYDIPVLTGEAANRLMREVAPLAARIVADWESEWDGHNHIAQLGADAQAAEAALCERLGLSPDGYGDPAGAFESADLVAEWSLEGAVNGSEAEDYNIGPDTTDARLDQIEASILADLASCSTPASGAATCPGLGEYLYGLRDEARQAA